MRPDHKILDQKRTDEVFDRIAKARMVSVGEIPTPEAGRSWAEDCEISSKDQMDS